MQGRIAALVVLLAVFAMLCRADLLVCSASQDCSKVDESCNTDTSNHPDSPSCVSKKQCCISSTCVGNPGQVGSCQADNAGTSCTVATAVLDCFWNRGSAVCSLVDQSGRGICANLGSKGAACDSATDCLSGVCEKKKCKALAQDELCDIELQACDHGLYCAATNNNSTLCVPRLADGEPCSYHSGQDLIFSDVYDINALLLPSQCESGYCKPGVAGNGTCAQPFQVQTDQPCESVIDCTAGLICTVGVDVVNRRLTPGFCESWIRPLAKCNGTSVTDLFPPEAGVNDPLCPVFPLVPTSQELLCGCDYLANDKAKLPFPLGACMPNSFSSMSGCFGELAELRACGVRHECQHLTSFEKGSCMNQRCVGQLRKLEMCRNELLRISSACASRQDKAIDHFKNQDGRWEDAGDWLTTKSGGVPNAAWIGIGVFACCVLIVCFVVLTIALSLIVKKIQDR